MSSLHLDDKESTIAQQNRTPMWRTMGRIAAIVTGVLVLLVVLALVFIDPLLNWYAKDKLTAAVNEKGGQELRIKSLHYSVLDNVLFLDSIAYSRIDTTQEGIAHLTIDTEYVSIDGASWLGLLFGNGLQVEGLMLQSPHVAITHSSGATVAKDSIPADTTSRKQSTADMLADVLPDKVLPLHLTQVLVDNGRFTQQQKGEKVVSDSAGRISLAINNLSVGSKSAHSEAKLYSSASVQISKLVWNLPKSDYAVRADSVAFFSGDSAASQFEMFALSFQPVLSDKEFFAKRKFRTARFRVTSPRFVIQGSNLRDILDGEPLQAQSISFGKPAIDILLDKRLPVDPTATPPEMPHEIIAKVDTPFQLDTLAMDSGTIRYSEMFPYDNEPAVLRFTNIQVRCTDILHRPQEKNEEKPVSIVATGNLAGAGALRVDMKLPLHSKSLNFTYTGKLGAMKAEALNEFLSVSDRIRITSGDVQSAGFTIKVSDGKASGTVQAIYKNLKIQTLNEKSGKAGGLVESFKTFLANTFKIRVNNTAGDIKTGNVNYVKKPDDAFMDVVWLSLRGGLGEIVGF